MTASVALERVGLGTTLAASAALHAGLLLGALAGWRAAQTAAFPLDAVEIAGDLMIPAGVKQRSREAVPLDQPRTSELDLAVKAETEKRPEPLAEAPAPETANQVLGEGGAAASASGRALTEQERYLGRLRERVLEELVYPRASKNLGETGQVRVRVDVLLDGTLSDIRVTQPSAFERLNVAAVETLRRVRQVEPPTVLSQAKLALEFPVDFALK